MPAGPQVFFLRLKTDPTAGGEGLRRNEGSFSNAILGNRAALADPHAT
jgi:hypothetical protein